MLSAKFLVISFLYLFHATRLVVADPRGGDQFCESVRTVTIVQTVTPKQPPPSSSPAKNPKSSSVSNKNGNPKPSSVTNKNGNPKSSSVNNKNNTKTSSTVLPTVTPPAKGNPKPSSVTNKNGNPKSSSVNNKNNTKTSSTVLPTTTPPAKGNPKPSSVTNKNGNPKSSSVNNKNNTKTSSTVLPTATPPADGNPKPSSVNNKNNSTETSSTVLPTATPPAKTNNEDQGNGDPNTSLTLDPSVIQNINGKAQGDGQIDSLVSPDNYINYCIDKTLTNGNQVKTGSCNPTPMGDIPSVDNMVSAKFNSPRNFDTIPANTPFTIALQIKNLDTGTFTNAANTYFAAPQQLVNGVVKGHSHVTVQKMASLDSTDPLDPKVFAFFKGINDPAKNGVLTTTVTNGLPPGVYRVSSITAASNHQEAVGPVAQRGSFNDAVYITVTEDGQNSNNVPPSSSPVDSTSSTVLPTSVSSSVLSSSVSSVSPPDSTSSIPPDVSSTTSPPLPTETDGKNNDSSSSEPPAPSSTDGKNNDESSSEPPAPSSTGGKNDGKKGDPTSSTLPATPTPTAGDEEPQGGNGPNSKRMNRRSRLA